MKYRTYFYNFRYRMYKIWCADVSIDNFRYTEFFQVYISLTILPQERSTYAVFVEIEYEI
jgi:hypothetical protein